MDNKPRKIISLKKILITGGSGLLATNWAIIQKKNFQVVLGLHNKILFVEGVQNVIINLDSVELFSQDVLKIQPDIIIHTAAISNVEFCEKNPDLAQKVNVSITNIVAKVCAMFSIKLVHISTDHLFDGTKQLVSEEIIPSPLNIYAKTKGEAEMEVLSFCPNSLIIRTNFYGWGPSYRNSFSDFIINNLRNGISINLFHDIYYSPIIISELVRIVHFLLDNGKSGIFNISGTERISKFEFGIKLASVFNLNASLISMGSINDVKNLVIRPLDMSLSNGKVNSILIDPITNIYDQLVELKEEELTFAIELKKICV